MGLFMAEGDLVARFARRLRESGVALRYPTFREGYRAVLAGEGVRHP